MPYQLGQTPDAPLSMSMATPAETLTGNDIVVIVQPLNAPGQKTRSMTLSQLAAFIAGGELGEIVFVNVNGFRSTVGKNGYNYHHDADQSYNANLDYAIDSNGIHAVLVTSGYTKRFEANGNSVQFSKSSNVRVDKVAIFENYMQISHQEIVNGTIINTHTSRIAWDHMRTPEVRVMQDENNYIPISWDSENNEFVIWQRTNDGTVAVPKLHVYGTMRVEKDLDAKGKSVFERLNVGSSNSFFKVDEDVYINTLLASTTIPVSEGDIVTVLNTSDSSVTVTMGTRVGSGGAEDKNITLNSLCAMQFICVLHQVTQSATYNEWAPLGNVTVTWST